MVIKRLRNLRLNPILHDADAIHMPYLDGCRGIAILTVLIMHFVRVHYTVGLLGVYLFFVLSGLLMSRILFADMLPLGRFFKHRIARIFPVLYLYLVVLGILTLIYRPANVAISDFFYSAVFLRTYFFNPGIWFTGIPIGHLWTLNIEVHCYILLSLVALAARHTDEKFARYAVSFISLVCLGFWAFYTKYPPLDRGLIFLRTECSGLVFFVSCSIFLWLRHLQPRIPSWLPLISAATGVAIALYSNDNVVLRYIIPALLLALSINTLHAAPRMILVALSNPVLVWFGLSSYSIYIWQEMFKFMTKEGHWAISYFPAFIMAMIVGCLSFYLYELPTRKWGRNLHIGFFDRH